MPGSGGVYAVKRRKRPVQKNAKPPPEKTNPSKRHRDRLNVELDRLTGLLPFSQEVRGRLDKLSVLRLSVGYLKVKSYFHATKSAPLVSVNGRNGQCVSLDGVNFSEGELLLQALNGFVLVVTTDGTIFYTSPTIQDYLGYHQSDVLHQSVYDLIHMDDRDMFKCQLHFALDPSENGSEDRTKASSSSVSVLPQYIPPENSSFLERSFCCRFRSLLDNTSGFLALNFNGRLKYLHLQGNMGADGAPAPPQLALFAVATLVQPPSVMEIRTKTFIFQTKHRMDFAPMGVDTRGKLVLGYSEIELVSKGSGYQFIHAADMMYCADSHLRMMKTGDSGFTFFRLLTKTGQWLWVQANARVVFKGGRPDFIIARQKALTNEEGVEHLHQRRLQLPFNLATGEGVLYDTSLDDFIIPGPGSVAPGTTESTAEKPLDPASLLGSLRQQDHSIYTQPQNPSPQLPVFSQIEDLDLDFEQPQSTLEQAFLDSHALLNVPSQPEGSEKTSITGDLTSEAMIDSLEQILEDIGDGGIEGLEVEDTELREWENTLAKVNKEREDVSNELSHILANDIFSYVEEALKRETGGHVLASDQTGPHVSGMVNILSLRGQHPGSVFSDNNKRQWQPVTGIQSGSAEQTLMGDAVGDGSCSAGLKCAPQTVSPGAAHRPTPTQCGNAHQGHASPLWPPSSSTHQMISTQYHHANPQPEATQHSWFPSVQNTNGINHNHRFGPELIQSEQYMINHAGSQEVYRGTQLQTPSVWQQLPQSFHHHTLTHSSHTPGSMSSAAQSLHPQSQQSTGGCMYEERQGRKPNTAAVPSRQNRTLLGPPGSRTPTHITGAATNAPFTMSHPGTPGPSAHMAACADVGNISSVHLSRGNAGLGAALSDFPTGNGSLQSSFFCWNGDTQIPKVPMNGAGDPFAFPALPTGSVNLSQNSDPQPPLQGL